MRLLPVLWLLAASLPAQREGAPSELPSRYRAAGELRWGSDAEGGEPFVYADPADPTREVGFEVDLAEALGRRLGVRMVRVQTPWERLVEALDRDDCDVAMNGLEPTPDRKPLVRFARPYYLFQQQLVALTASPIATLDDCAGRRVGCLGLSASHLALQADEAVEPVVYEDPVKILEEVRNGRNAAALLDLPMAAAFLARFPELSAKGAPFGESFYAMAVRRTEPELQRALDAAALGLFESGELERICRKWGLWNEAQRRLGDADVAAAVAEPAAAVEFDWPAGLGLLAAGAARTVGISLLAFAIAAALGLCLCVARLYGPRWLRWAAVAYIEFFRGTPVLVQLLFLYYGLGQIPALQMPAWVAGVLGLGLNYAAYEAEVYRGAIAAVPRGQGEAALALGMGGALALRLVVLPQALRLSLPASTNDFVALFKDSSVVMVISVVELSKQYQMLASSTGSFLGLGAVTCALYLAMSLPLAWLARRFERRLDKDRA